jgi:hypothetical protein
MFTRRSALVVVVLGLAVQAQAQEPPALHAWPLLAAGGLKQDGALKSKGGKVAAALAFAPDDRVVAAYVATGQEGEKDKLRNWAEVRFLDVASGKHSVLARKATPAALPGIGANYTLLGFTADGKKVVVSTTDPGGTTSNLLLDVPDIMKELKKVEGSKK